MIEQLKQDINKIRHRLSLKFLLISYFWCTLFDMFFGKYMELGLVLSVIGTLAWVINKSESEYNKIMDAVAKYRESDNFFVIGKLISVKASFLFGISFSLFFTVQLILCPLPSIGALIGYFLYLSVIMLAINGEYNPLALEKQRYVKSKFDDAHDEYIFSQNIDESRRDINDTWYSDPCLPGNPIFHINK